MCKYAIVTGAASGIGKAIAEQLSKNKVVVFGIDKKDFSIDGVRSIIGDVSDNSFMEKCSCIIKKTTEQIDYLVIAAGILCDGNRNYIISLSLTEWNNVLSTNLTGAMLSLQMAAPFLKKSKNASVVLFSSDQVLRPVAKSGAYSISKAGIEALTKLASMELLNYRIRVNCIRAAAVDTDFLSTLVPDISVRREMTKTMAGKMPLGMISPHDVENLAFFLLSEDSDKITGQVLTIDSGYLL